MPTCARCSTQNPDGHRFCGGCGQPLVPTSAVPASERVTRAPSPFARPGDGGAEETGAFPRPAFAPPTAAPAAPPAVPPTPGPRPVLPPSGPVDRVGSLPSGRSFDWQRLLVGNWLGAGLTAGTALAVAGALSLALALLAKPADFGVDNGLALVATLLGAAFGADLVMHLEEPGRGTESYDAHLGMFSLTVTIVALVAAAYVFRRVTARYPRPLDAIADAGRAALLLGLGVMVCAIVFRADNDKMGRGWAASLASGPSGVDATWGPSIVGALFLPVVVLFVTLALVTFAARRDGWPAPVQRAHDWLAAPLYGLATIVLMLPVAGVIGLLLLILTGSEVHDNDPTSSDLSAGISLIVGLLASGGFWLLSLGGGAGYGASSSESGAGAGGGDDTEVYRLGHYASDTPGLWAAPVVLLVVLLLAAFVVARRTTARERVVGNLGAWVVSLLVALPLLSRLSSLHGGIDTESGGGYHADYYIGQTGWETTVLLTLVALVCAGVVALATGALDRDQLRTQASGLARRMQSDPGRPAAAPSAPPAVPQSAPPSGWYPPGTQPVSEPSPPAPVPGSPWPQTAAPPVAPATTPMPQAPPQQQWPPADSGPDDGRTRIRPAQPPQP